MNTHQNHDERRRLDRHEVNGQVDAVDRLTGQTFGRLVDIHSEGLMLITDGTVDVGNIYQFLLQKEGDVWLEVGVECLWKNPANGDDRYWSGFRVIDACDQVMAQLKHLGLEG